MQEAARHNKQFCEEMVATYLRAYYATQDEHLKKAIAIRIRQFQDILREHRRRECQK